MCEGYWDEEFPELEEWKKGQIREDLRDLLAQIPFSSWTIKRFLSYSHGIDRSIKALRIKRSHLQRHPYEKMPTLRRAKRRPNEVLLVCVPQGNGRLKCWDISPDSKRKDRLREELDKHIKEELDVWNINLKLLGENEIDYFLECVEKILEIKERIKELTIT